MKPVEGDQLEDLDETGEAGQVIIEDGTAGGFGGTLLRTIDGGVTWHAATVPGARVRRDLDFRGVRATDDHTR